MTDQTQAETVINISEDHVSELHQTSIRSNDNHESGNEDQKEEDKISSNSKVVRGEAKNLNNKDLEDSGRTTLTSKPNNESDYKLMQSPTAVVEAENIQG